MDKQGAQQPSTVKEKLIPSFSFFKQIEERSGQQLRTCYQCQKCSGGCPVSSAMDYLPHQIVRYVQFGMLDPLLKSKSIWVCIGCKICAVRCPNGIDLADLNDVLKEIATERGLSLGSGEIRTFHKVLLSSIKRYGRVHELGMAVEYKMKVKTHLHDIQLGLRMFRLGLLKMLPNRVKQKSEIKEIFRKAKE